MQLGGHNVNYVFVYLPFGANSLDDGRGRFEAFGSDDGTYGRSGGCNGVIYTSIAGLLLHRFEIGWAL